jgi:ATP-binding cassette subfamily B protein/subfamily B ATP-binding cassette protein MsbA
VTPVLKTSLKSAKPAPSLPAGVSSLRLCVRLLRDYGWEEKWTVLGGLSLLAATSGAHLLQPWPMKWILDLLTGNTRTSAVLSALAPAFGGGPGVTVGLLCCTILAIHLLAGVLNVMSTYLLVAAGLRMVNRLRCAVFDHVQRLSLKFHDTTSVGDSLYRVTWDTYCIQTIFNSGFIPLIGSSLTLAGVTAMMVSRDVLVASIALAVMIPITLLMRRLERPMTERSLLVHETESSISSHVQETLTGIRAVQAFGREELESERFRRSSNESLQAKLRLYVLESISGVTVSLLLACGSAVVVAVSAARVLQGRLTPGDVVLLLAYVTMLYKPLSSIAKTSAQLQGAAARAWRVVSLLDAAPDVRDCANPINPSTRATGYLTLHNVGFSYVPDQPVLRGITAEIAAGSTVALVGPSGAGKTTLVSLLMRFYDPTSGLIALDGHDLRALSLKYLRRSVALVLQEPVLFASSVRENIAYGRPGATDGQVRFAAAAAGATSFIEALAQGFDTQIGERGVSLSGGQRQRLSIARAFLQDAPILLMDEPTSALDAVTEAALLRTLEQLKRGRTTIIIAHRFSTIRGADKILVLEQGRIVEAGSHERLLGQDGIYARFHAAQFGSVSEPDGEGAAHVV